MLPSQQRLASAFADVTNDSLVLVAAIVKLTFASQVPYFREVNYQRQLLLHLLSVTPFPERVRFMYTGKKPLCTAIRTSKVVRSVPLA